MHLHGYTPELDFTLSHLHRTQWPDMLSGVTPMGSGWANPRAPRLMGHPQGALRVPFHSCVPAKVILSKKMPLSNNFFTVWLQNSHNELFHKLMTKNQNYWVPLQLGPTGWGEEVHIWKIYRDVPPKWVDFTQKICKHGSHFDPPQKIPKQVKL